MSGPHQRREHNKLSGIANIVCGGVLTLNALGSALLLAIDRDVKPQFIGDKYVQVTAPTANSFVPAIILSAIGIAMIVWGCVLIRRHTRDKLLTLGASPQAQARSTAPQRATVPLALRVVPGVGYRSFVAWRYLLVYSPAVTLRSVIILASMIALRALMVAAGIEMFPQETSVGSIAGNLVNTTIIVTWYFTLVRHSRLASIFYIFGLTLSLQCMAIDQLAAHGRLPFLDLEQARIIRQTFGIIGIFGSAIWGLAWFFGTLRSAFTFFTTVPIGGVWIGTSALVVVLAVMSGFETDLRDKILGSNAHIQVTKEDGSFVEWREVKKKIDAIPGVVASTPFAVSEVVIAANNNGMPVIIKGIDPANVGKVTDLVNDLEDKDAMKRLEPLIDLEKERTTVAPSAKGSNLDPPPDDMVTGGDPIDFSGDAGAGAGFRICEGCAGQAERLRRRRTGDRR